jgi:hypothetical protein
MDGPTSESQLQGRPPVIAKLPGGVEWPIPRWALAPGALVLLLALTGYVAKQFGVPIVVEWRTLEEEHARADAQSAREREAYKHSSTGEQPVPIFSSDHGELKVNLFKSDGCVQVVRSSSPEQHQADWLVAPVASGQAAPGRIAAETAVPPGALPWEATAEAQPAPGGPPPPRGCINPHPGDFKQRDGQKQGCWQQKFREWADGCQHYQWFNTCSNVWDVDQNGSPRVYWTVCRH